MSTGLFYGSRKSITFGVLVLFLVSGMLLPAMAATSVPAKLPAHVQTPTVSKTPPTLHSAVSAKNPCPCIVFRLDGVRGSYLPDVQTKVIDEFQKKNASLTIGVTGSDLHLDTKLVSYLKGQLKPGHATIEIANNGWKHENFAAQGMSQQVLLMNKTNQELQQTLGKKPSVFATPYGMYDNNTLKTLKQLKMNAISSDIWGEDKFVTTSGKVTSNKDSFGIYHVPSMTGFQADLGNESYWTSIPRDKIVSSIDTHIAKYGYDVILLHPENFAVSINGKYTNAINKASFDELSSILDYVKSKHIKITGISDIVGLDRQNTVQVIPVSAKPAVLRPSVVPSSSSGPDKPIIAPLASQIVQAPRSVTPSEPNGTLNINLRYFSGDRISTSGVSMEIYRDFESVPYVELKSVPENPYTIESLPMYHQYKIVVYVGGMLSSTTLVTLDDPVQNLDVNTPDGSAMIVSVYYNDGQTPIPDAKVSIKSQDNKTRVTGVTDSDGSASRFYLPPTLVYGNYYVVNAEVSNHLKFSSAPVMLQPGDSNEVRLVAPWPSVVQNLVTIQVYNQTHLLSSPKKSFAVYMYDNTGQKVGESSVNIHGEGYFWSMKVGDYVFKVVNTADNKVLGTVSATIDGTKNNFYIVMQGPAPESKGEGRV